MLQQQQRADWFLNRTNEAMDELKREVDGAPITLLCHSAGGWLGRVFMLEFGITGIDRWVVASRAGTVIVLSKMNAHRRTKRTYEWHGIYNSVAICTGVCM